jgi:hypothetical protein
MSTSKHARSCSLGSLKGLPVLKHSLFLGILLVLPLLIIDFQFLVDQNSQAVEEDNASASRSFEPPIKKTVESSSSSKNVVSSSITIKLKQQRLKPSAKFPKDKPFCLPWTLNADDWWTRHPSWEQGM